MNKEWVSRASLLLDGEQDKYHMISIKFRRTRLHSQFTLQFPLAEVDPDGILILDLRTAVANPTSVASVKKREAAKPRLEVGPRGIPADIVLFDL